MINNSSELPFSPRYWFKLFKKAYRKTPAFFRDRLLWSFRQSCLPWFVVPMIVRHRNGAKFYLSRDPIDDRVLSGIYGNFYDLYFPQSLDIPANSLLLDIGAHHGFYTIAALYQYPGIHIISIEPDPLSANLLRRNVELNRVNDCVKVVNAAFGREDGNGWLTRDNEGSWGNYVGEHGNASVEVQIVSIESVLGEKTPFLVKCNSEGGEFYDIPALFERAIFPNLILLFVHPDRGNENELIRFLHSCNYDVQPFLGTSSHPRYICKKKDFTGG